MVAIAVNNNAQPSAEASYDQPVVGLILPPPEIRSIVDKTASFVARNGEQFEQKIKQNEMNNAKFNFLKEDDPYNVYYQKKVKDFSEGTATLVKQDENQEPPPVSESQKPKIIIPTEPPVEFEFCHDPPTMNALELDIVKLTAQFVARNGRSFLTQLMQKEAKNYQFDFLRPQHTLFQYFSKLVEQYNKVLIPSKAMRQKLRQEMFTQQLILNDVNYRAEWGRYQERIRKQEQEKQEKERVAYAEIDWHDFVIVETVDFPLHERSDLPPPVTKEQLGVRMARIMRLEESGGAAEEPEQPAPVQTPTPVPSTAPKAPKVLDHDLGQEVVDVPVAPPKAMVPKESAPPVPSDIVIRKDYDPKANTRTKVVQGDVEYLISPLTGQPIPASKMAEHMKVGLLDPSWVDQRKTEIQKKKDEEDYYAQDESVVNSLVSIARRRTDIFGVAGEAGIGRQVGEELKPSQEIGWDGHKRTAGSAMAERMQTDHDKAKDRMDKLNRGIMPDDLKDKNFGAPGPQKQPAMPLPGSMTGPKMIPLVRQVVPQPVVPIGLQQRHHMQPQQMMVQQRGVMMGGVGMQLGMRPPMPGSNAGMAVGMRPMMPGQHSATMPGLRPPMGAAGMDMSGGPPAKKSRPEDTLIPEEQFLRQHPANVSFQVSVPKVEKDDWNCRGQLIHINMSLKSTFSDVKQKIESETGMPPAKQKLQCEGVFVKDSNTLAFYNIRPSSLILMTLKERGGRKR